MRPILQAGGASGVLLIGGVLLAGAGSSIVAGVLGEDLRPVNIGLVLLVAVAGLVAGGAAWGWSLSRITAAGDGRRMALAGALGFAPVVIVAVVALTLGEFAFVQQRLLPDVPIHNIYTLLFVPAAALVTGVGGFALSVGASRAGAWSLSALCALGGGIAFLTVNLTLDALGMRVGAPGAELRATMLVTTLLGDTAAATVAGAIIASALLRQETRLQARALI